MKKRKTVGKKGGKKAFGNKKPTKKFSKKK
jgi:hypothetical protein